MEIMDGNSKGNEIMDENNKGNEIMDESSKGNNFNLCDGNGYKARCADL